MKCALLLVFGLLGLGTLPAQNLVSVIFKAFPPDYEVMVGGNRLSYSPREDGLRTYGLPEGTVQVNLTAPGSRPLRLDLMVKAGMPVVEAKLEPRQGPLELLAEAATGKSPRSVAFSADGRHLFVALQGDPGVDVYDVPSLKKTQRLLPKDGATTGFTDVLPLGSEVWTVQTDGRIHTFDATTLEFKDSHDLTGGGNAFLTDLGSGRVALVNWDSGQLSAVDTALRKPVATVTTTASVRGFAFAQGLVFASYFDRGQVAVFDASTWKLKATWSAGRAPRPVAALGNLVFVGDMASAQVLVIDTGTGKVVSTLGVPSNPHQMTASSTLVAVASRGRNNPNDYQRAGPDYGKVTLVNAQGAVVGSVWGRNQPTGLALSSDGRYLAFTDVLDNNLELYRIEPLGPQAVLKDSSVLGFRF